MVCRCHLFPPQFIPPFAEKGCITQMKRMIIFRVGQAINMTMSHWPVGQPFLPSTVDVQNCRPINKTASIACCTNNRHSSKPEDHCALAILGLRGSVPGEDRARGEGPFVLYPEGCMLGHIGTSSTLCVAIGVVVWAVIFANASCRVSSTFSCISHNLADVRISFGFSVV